MGLPVKANGMAVEAPKTAQLRRPAPWMYQYAFFLARHLLENKPVPTQRKLAELCNVHETTVCKALARPEVQAFVDDELDRHLGPTISRLRRVKGRLYGQAMAGDKEAARILLQSEGALVQGASATAGAAVSNEIHLHFGAPTGGL